MKHFSPVLRFFLMLCICLSLLALSPVSIARAGLISVTSLGDNGPGTLRNAIATANPGDIINFSVTGSIILTTGQLVVSTNLTINGPGVNLLTINGNANGRIFDIGPGAVVTITDMTVTNGNVSTDGGAIRNQGTLTLTNLSVLSNVATAAGSRGGGIMNLGTLTMDNSTIHDNEADQYGGGIYSDVGTTLNLTNDVISSNAATAAAGLGSYGGGIAVYSAVGTSSTLVMSKSTVMSNTAHTSGGGIAFASANPAMGVSGTLNIADSAIFGNQATYNLGGRGGGIWIELPSAANLTNTTISSNTSADNGGGMYLLAATVSINNVTIASNTGLIGGGVFIHNNIVPISSTLNTRNSIIADNIATATVGPAPDCYAFPNNSINSQDYNLIEDRTACLIAGTTTHDIYGTDPVLGPLGINGGSPLTHALNVGSPAIDKGDPLTCTATDQRAVTRPRDGDNDGTSICDIGAFERKANAIAIYRSTGAYDGHVLESNETNNTGGTLDKSGTTFYLGDATGDKQYRAILSFNTTGLPDNATVVKATLNIRRQTVVGTDPFTILAALVADIRKPYFGGTAGLVTSDFQALANRSAVGSFPNAPVNNWYSAVIAPAGLRLINKTGTTQFRLRFSTDDNDDGAADYMRFFSGNYATVGVRPKLIITYYDP